jgi:hypothetical protein
MRVLANPGFAFCLMLVTLGGFWALLDLRQPWWTEALIFAVAIPFAVAGVAAVHGLAADRAQAGGGEKPQHTA